jgi:DNA-binding FadR family transcriptional regulator
MVCDRDCARDLIEPEFASRLAAQNNEDDPQLLEEAVERAHEAALARLFQ